MVDEHTDDDIRRRFDRKLIERQQKRMSASEWRFVQRRRLVDSFRDVLAGFSNEGEVALQEMLEEIVVEAADLIEDVRLKEQEDGAAPPPVQPRSPWSQVPATKPEDTPREVILGFAVAGLAAQDREVRAFLDKELNGRHVIDQPDGWTDPAEWIERRWNEEQPPQHEGDDPLPTLSYSPYPGTLLTRAEIEHPPVRTLRVAPGGTLDRLRKIADGLARTYRWDQAEAVTFILTGTVWPVPSFSARVEWCEAVPALSRIIMVVDPTVPPQDLRAKYQDLRGQITGGKFPREMDAKSMWLGAFSAGRAADKTARELMAEWNALFPNWPYEEKDVDKFGSQRRDAEDRLLRRDFNRPTAEHTDAGEHSGAA